LNEWIENLSSDKDQKILFELVPHIFYIGREELNLLYREAYITHFARWLIDISNIDLASKNIESLLNEKISETWFCPLTDSFRINQFYHLNSIPAKNDLRPDWRSLRYFSDIVKINKYLTDNNLKQIVLLEDFVGNGGQVSKAVAFAAENFPDIPILILPLIICPEGIKNSNKFVSKYPNVKISPVMELSEKIFIKKNIAENETDFFKALANLAIDSYPKVSNSTKVPDGTDPDPYGPFGWRNTGGMVVMHTNTPNNSLPLIHFESESWTPLFKRHKRI
jgi:hypothetical protein